MIASGQTITSPRIEISGEIEKSPLYRVVLLDDDDHTYDYVIEMLQKIFVFSLEEAFRHAEDEFQHEVVDHVEKRRASLHVIAAPDLPLHLPWPRDPRACAVADALVASCGGRRSAPL